VEKVEHLRGQVTPTDLVKQEVRINHLIEPILQVTCNCLGCRPEGGIHRTEDVKLHYCGFDVNLNGLGLSRVRHALIGGLMRDKLDTITTWFQDSLFIVDNLCVPLWTYRKKPQIASILGPSIRSTALYWFVLRASGLWVKELKYQLTWLFNHGEVLSGESTIEYPVRKPSIFGRDGLIAYGSIQKQYDLLIRTKSNREVNRSFRNTVLQGVKRGMPTVDKDFIKQAAADHRAVLSVQRETPSEILDFFEEEVIKMFKKPFREDYSKIGAGLSHKACSERPLAKLGSLAEVFDYTLNGSVQKILASQIGETYLFRMTYSPRFGVEEHRFRFHIGSMIHQCHLRSLEPDYQVPDTFVKFILEPLKCRTITKAPAFVNGLYRQIQQYLWGTLREDWRFSLIGETVGREHITNLQEESGYCFPEDTELLWVSGDYSAATDNLNMDVTTTIVDALMRNDWIYRMVMRRGLIGNKINYTNCHPALGESEIPSPFVQTNGQLMGCIFSFVVLCIANFLAFKYAARKHFGKDHLYVKRCPVLINGDDILFNCPPDFPKVWSETVSQVGFEKSVGKNFEAKKFCTINSQYFLFKSGRVKAIPYLNQGFIFDQKKGEDTDTLDPALGQKTVNEKLYSLNFTDYFKGWVGSCMESRIGRALGILLGHRKDIGWSGRGLHDLGLSTAQDPLPVRILADRIATEKACGTDGYLRSIQSSNKVYSLIGTPDLPDIKRLKQRCERQAKLGLVAYMRSRLVGEARKSADLRFSRSGGGISWIVNYLMRG